MSSAWDSIIYEVSGCWVIASRTLDGWLSGDTTGAFNRIETAPTLEDLAKQIRQYPTKARAVAKARTRYPIGSRAFLHMTNQC